MIGQKRQGIARSEDVTQPYIARQLKRREDSDEQGQKARRQKQLARYRSDQDAGPSALNTGDAESGGGSSETAGQSGLQLSAPFGVPVDSRRVGNQLPTRDPETGRLISANKSDVGSSERDVDDGDEGAGDQ